MSVTYVLRPVFRPYIGFREDTCSLRRDAFEAYSEVYGVEEQRVIQMKFSYRLNDAVWFELNQLNLSAVSIMPS